MRVSNSLLFTAFIHSCFVLLKGVLVHPKSLNIVHLHRKEAGVRILEGFELLRELLETEFVILLLLQRLEALNVLRFDVQRGLFWIVIIGDDIVLLEGPVSLAPQIEATI